MLTEAEIRSENEQAEIISIFDEEKDKITAKCNGEFSAALSAFTKIKHLRGMALSTRGLFESKSKLQSNGFNCIESEQSEEAFLSESFSSSSSEEEDDRVFTKNLTVQDRLPRFS